MSMVLSVKYSGVFLSVFEAMVSDYDGEVSDGDGDYVFEKVGVEGWMFDQERDSVKKLELRQR
jgi:hypothetical protein